MIFDLMRRRGERWARAQRQQVLEDSDATAEVGGGERVSVPDPVGETVGRRNSTYARTRPGGRKKGSLVYLMTEFETDSV